MVKPDKSSVSVRKTKIYVVKVSGSRYFYNSSEARKFARDLLDAGQTFLKIDQSTEEEWKEEYKENDV